MKYLSGKLEITSSPKKVLFYKILKPLEDNDLVLLEKEFEDLNLRKLNSLEISSEALKKGRPIAELIEQHFIPK